jgi:hypothetical protein
MSSVTKKCPKCKVVKPTTEYSKSQYRVGAYCKPCMTEYNNKRNQIKKERLKKGYWL